MPLDSAAKTNQAILLVDLLLRTFLGPDVTFTLVVNQAGALSAASSDDAALAAKIAAAAGTDAKPLPKPVDGGKGDATKDAEAAADGNAGAIADADLEPLAGT